VPLRTGEPPRGHQGAMRGDIQRKIGVSAGE